MRAGVWARVTFEVFDRMHTSYVFSVLPFKYFFPPIPYPDFFLATAGPVFPAIKFNCINIRIILEKQKRNEVQDETLEMITRLFF